MKLGRAPHTQQILISPASLYRGFPESAIEKRQQPEASARRMTSLMRAPALCAQSSVAKVAAAETIPPSARGVCQNRPRPARFVPPSRRRPLTSGGQTVGHTLALWIDPADLGTPAWLLQCCAERRRFPSPQSLYASKTCTLGRNGQTTPTLPFPTGPAPRRQGNSQPARSPGCGYPAAIRAVLMNYIRRHTAGNTRQLPSKYPKP